MTHDDFKKFARQSLLTCGLTQQGTSYYRRSVDLICVVGLQKSSFQDAYYFNIGYVLRAIHPGVDMPRFTDGDVRTRFGYTIKGVTRELWEPVYFESAQQLNCAIRDNVSELLTGIDCVSALKALLARCPALLYQTTIQAKQFLGLDV
jgi:hypothetical protein